jgi:hypothetical protein
MRVRHPQFECNLHVIFKRVRRKSHSQADSVSSLAISKFGEPNHSLGLKQRL